MKCPKCGKEIAKDSFFCEYCGTQVKKNRKPLFIAIAIVACLLIFGGIGLTMYNKGEQEKARIERELLMSKREAAEAEAKAEHEARLKAEAEAKAKAEHEARLKAEAEARLEREAAEKAKYNGHEYVDLGLSVKWATCNVGANKPEDYGNYYAWGETSTKSTYSESNTCGKHMYDIKGNSQYDAARANWGGTWRLPTKAELEELNNKCTWKWTTQNGVNGYKVVGPNGNSIFLPAAGCRFKSSLYDAGSDGCYWSSTPYDDDYYYYNDAYNLDFNIDNQYVYIDGRRYYGLSVRPVVE